MEETTMNQLDNLLLQLGIEIRELAQKKDNLKQQIQISESNIQEKKDYVNKTQSTIIKLDEEIQQKQNNMKFLRENNKNLQRTHILLLENGNTLEVELDRRQDCYNQDMKRFQDQMESYRSMFQNYKDRCCQNPLAQKLLQIQAQNEEIEGRIRAIEEQILEKNKKLAAALSDDEEVTDGAERINIEKSKCQDNVAIQDEHSGEIDAMGDPVKQGPEEPAVEDIVTEELLDYKQNETEESASEIDSFRSGLWTKRDSGEDEMEDVDEPAVEVTEVEENTNTSCSEHMVELMEEAEAPSAGIISEDTGNEGAFCLPPSPTRIQAAPNTPTFSLNNSPSSSPRRQRISETKSPAFIFSMNSCPNTPAFSKLDCDFNVESGGEESSPFAFTSSYFSDKKSPGSEPKFSGEV